MKKNKRQIVIIGSGISGYAAALAAKTAETEVTVVDRMGTAGGQATHVNVGTICGLFSNEKLVEHPFIHVFFQKYQAYDTSANVLKHAGYRIMSYDYRKFERFILDEFERFGIRFLPMHELTSVEVSNSMICSITLQNNDTKNVMNYKVDAVVDCSGKAVISSLLNRQRISSSRYQAPAYVFEIRGLKEASEFQFNMALARLCQRNDFPMLYLIPGSLKNGMAQMKLALKFKASDDAVQMNELLKETKDFVVTSLIPKLKTESSLFTSAELTHLFPELGIRTAQRSVGKQILSEMDVLHGEQQDNIVALGTWPMEEWDDSGRVKITELMCSAYGIPADCLQSIDFNNVFLAGKTISADEKAISSARVMGTCLQTGYAAGKMAAAACQEDLEREVERLSNVLMSYV